MSFYSHLEALSHTIIQLKIIVVTFLFVVAGLSYGLVTLTLRDPLLIDRGCVKTALVPADSGKRTESEIKAFVREAASERVDSDQDFTPLLSDAELKTKIAELAELKKRDLRQRLIVEGVTVTDNEARVEGVRLFSVGDLRSAIKAVLIFKFAAVSRTRANPYGLVLLSSQAQDKNSPADLEKTQSVPSTGGGK